MVVQNKKHNPTKYSYPREYMFSERFASRLRMLLKRGMGNGEWGMGNGEWGMGNGEWEWGMGN